MIDSTNPRVMADNIRHLTAGEQANASAIEALQTYSTNEVDTGMLWVDRSPIYRKSFVVNSLPNTDLMSISHGIVNLSVILSITGTVKYGTRFTLLPRVAIDQSTLSITDASISVSVTDTGLSIRTYSDQTSNSAYITLEYTKSAPSSLTSPSPDDSRSIENEDPEIRSEVNEEAPEEEPVVETKTTRKKSTSTK